MDMPGIWVAATRQVTATTFAKADNGQAVGKRNLLQTQVLARGDTADGAATNSIVPNHHQHPAASNKPNANNNIAAGARAVGVTIHAVSGNRR